MLTLGQYLTVTIVQTGVICAVVYYLIWATHKLIDKVDQATNKRIDDQHATIATTVSRVDHLYDRDKTGSD